MVSEDDETKVSYDYVKVADTFKTPYMYLKAKEYDKALEGYLELIKQDSTQVYIEEVEINRLGYNLLRTEAFEHAITVFKMNVGKFLFAKADVDHQIIGQVFKLGFQSIDITTYRHQQRRPGPEQLTTPHGGCLNNCFKFPHIDIVICQYRGDFVNDTCPVVTDQVKNVFICFFRAG